VIRVNPKFVIAYLALGAVYVIEGDVAAAQKQHKILKKLDEDLAGELLKIIENKE
jgi:hypothetical protein